MLQRERLDGGVEVLRLDRPQRRNAMDTALLQALVEAIDGAGADDAVGALVFSTTSTTALSAGADVAEELDPEGGVARMEAFARFYAAVDACPVPTVAVCVGNCVGAGAELVAGCDLRVIGDNLKLAWAGARHGVPVGPARLTPLLGLARAKDLVLTGRVVNAAEAVALGLGREVLPAAEAEAAGIELARAVAANRGARTLKRLFAELERVDERIGFENRLLVDFQRSGAGLPRR